VHSFLSRITLSILSSARSTISVPKLAIRLLSFMRTVAAPRPPRAYSVFRTTIGSLPCMMTLPARFSWSFFIASCLELGLWPPDALAGGPQAGRRAVPMHVLRRGCAAHVGDTRDARTSGHGQDIDLPRPLWAKPQIVSGLRDEAEKRRQGAAICYCHRTAQLARGRYRSGDSGALVRACAAPTCHAGMDCRPPGFMPVITTALSARAQAFCLAWPSCIRHSGWMPAARITCPHLRDSAAWNAASPSGVLVTTSPLVLAR